MNFIINLTSALNNKVFYISVLTLFVLSVVFFSFGVSKDVIEGGKNNRFGDILIDDVSAEVVDVESKVNGVSTENTTFSIYIQKINLFKQIELNIDPRYPDEYLPVIDRSVAHGKYTYTPDMVAERNAGITYLYAHRDGKHGFFNRLDELLIGDEILIAFDGKIYTYRVTNKFIIDPTDTHFYTATSPTPLLRLQTCENGESQRLMIDAELIG